MDLSTINAGEHLLLKNLLARKRAREQAERDLDGAMEPVNREFARRIYAHLDKQYPGHFWEVECQLQHGKLEIRLPHLDIKGMFVNLHDLNGDPGLKTITKVGGELLERYRQKRGKFDEAGLLAAHARHGDPLFRKDVEVEG